ncbi:hypothetical protein L3X38_037772 [Prunus dulcis]|uniref:Syntaxin N-terminal domain-containing protein n=1 Tax=Prunus dulcis TaxID=3755 RepID=A0AAD4V597_PRUDU|nr:hypothetical protein L3X38_037772 [Prunus dulcis]
MNDLMTKSFTNYVDLKKEAMKDLDLEAGDNNVEMSSSMTHMHTDPGLFLEEAEKQANEESKSLHKSEALQSLRSRINADIMTVLKKTRSIRSQLEDMDCANAANRRLSAYKEGSPIYRTRIAITNGLRKEVSDPKKKAKESL